MVLCVTLPAIILRWAFSCWRICLNFMAGVIVWPAAMMLSALWIRVSSSCRDEEFWARSRWSENSLLSAESVPSPILDFWAGNCLPRFDRVDSPNSLDFDYTVLPNPSFDLLCVVLTKENFCSAIGTASLSGSALDCFFFFLFLTLDILLFGMTSSSC